jgi:tetratricopeptide (TPR) repeat protein
MLAAMIGGALGCASEVEAQQWTWPERAQNLTELPADFPPERLRAVMMGFVNALGVRCTHCHVGEEGQPLGTYDFASDANPNKNTARAMYRLLGAVNDHLDGVEPTGERVNMWCHTCHNGKPRPQTIDEAVMETYRAQGPDAAVASFRALREEYYGGPGYDFRAPAVNQLGATLLAQGDTVTALAFAELNLEHYPDVALTHERMGDLMAARGERAGARGHYERALALEPENPRLRRKLEGLGS